MADGHHTAGGDTKATFRDQFKSLVHSPWMYPALAFLSFLENTILLFAIEPLFIPVMVARRKQAFLIAGAMVVGSLAGGLVTYWLAASLYDSAIQPFLDNMGLADTAQSVRADIEERGFIAMFIIGLTPVPFQLGTIAAGAIAMPLPLFIAAIVTARGLRYGALALLVYWVGNRAEQLIEDYQLEIFIGFGVLFVLLVLVGFLL